MGKGAAGGGFRRRARCAWTGASRACLRAQSRFGAELDSLSDVIAFGVAPSVIIFLWSLHDAPKFGWTAALALAVCCALRLARFNSRMDAEEQPHKAAGFYTGIPAPVGAGLAFVPIYLWFVTGNALFRAWYVTMPWVLFIALLMISSRRDLQLVVDPPAPFVADAGDCRDRLARRGAGDRDLAHLAGDQRDLSRAAAIQHCSLCKVQAAARSPACARSGRRGDG